MLTGIYRRYRRGVHNWYNEIIVLVELFRHSELPRTGKILLFSLLAYIFSPIDLIPDIIPLIGDLDDFIAILIVTKLVKRITPIELIERVRTDVAADSEISLFKNRKMKIAAIFIILAKIGLTWLFLIIFDIKRYLGILF